MVGLAIVMFVGLFAFGHEALGWDPNNSHIQLGIFLAFTLGILCGYKARG